MVKYKFKASLWILTCGFLFVVWKTSLETIIKESERLKKQKQLHGKQSFQVDCKYVIDIYLQNLYQKIHSTMNNFQNILTGFKKNQEQRHDIVESTLTESANKTLIRVKLNGSEKAFSKLEIPPKGHYIIETPQKDFLPNNKSDLRQNTSSECSGVFADWRNRNVNKSFNMKEVNNFEMNFCVNNPPKQCTNYKLVGRLAVLQDQISLDWVYENELKFVHKGGWWSPENCQPVQSTFIVVPFRKREHQLPILLRQLHPLLKRQKLHYRIFVVEQEDKSTFNRAKLLNVGYREGLKYFPYKCFVMHDVDLIPENDRIDYGCKTSPKHLSAAVSTFHYRLPYATIFGGVASMWSRHFEMINGCSNTFWSWGGEDDNLVERLLIKNLRLHRDPLRLARFKMLPHTKYQYSKGEHMKKMKHLKKSFYLMDKDGLNNLQYELLSIEEKRLFTLVKVNLKEETF